jgi:3-methyladenine DNA glycosylase AlkD
MSPFKKLKKRIFKRSCRQVARLISDMQERPLGWFDRTVLRMHLNICDTCVRYEKQVQFMGQAMGRWKNYGDDETRPGVTPDPPA